MTRARRLWAVYGTLAVLAAAGACALVLTSDHETQKLTMLVLGEFVGLSFVAAGLLGLSRRPGNGTAKLLAAVGFTFFVGALAESNASVLATIGSALSILFLAVFLHLLVAYPTGVLATRFERRLVAFAYVVAIGFPVLYLLFAPQLDPSCDGCPENALLVHESDAAATVIEVVASVAAAAAFIATIVLLVRRWRSASAAYRRGMRLVLVTGGIAVGLFVLELPLEPLLPHDGDVVLETLSAVAFVCVPFAFAAGLLRGRLATAAVGRLVADLGPVPAPGRLRDALRQVLGDPTLELGYWLPSLPGFVDIAGRPFDLHENAAATIVEGETGRIGVLVHDPVLLEDRGLLDGAVAAARLALENERLHADLRARVRELERERDFTRLVVNTAPAYFCVVDAGGRIVRFNTTLEQVTGIRDDSGVRGREFWDVFTTPEHADAVRSSLALAAVAGRTEPHDATLRATDGSLRTVSWTEIVIPDEQGQLQFVLVSGLDVTAPKQHEEALHRVVDEQAALRRVATLVAGGPSESELLASVTAEVAQLFGAEAAHMWRYEGEGVYLTGGWNVAQSASRADTFHIPDPDTLVGRIAATHAPGRRDDYTGATGVVGELVRTTGIRSAIGAPIVVGGQLWGAMVVSTVRDEPFPHGAEARLGDFAALVAQAVANADARTELANLADEQAALRRVATLVAAGAGQEELVTAVTAAVGRLFGAQSATTLRWDGDSVRVLGGWNEPGARTTEVGRVIAFGGDMLTARVVTSGRPARVDSREDVRSAIGREIWDELGLHATIGAPIVVDGRTWGVITASRSTPGDPFPPGAEHRLGDFAALVAQAIANAEARREVAALAEEQAALRRVATLVAAGRPEVEVLDALTREVGILFGAQAVNLVRWEGIFDEVRVLGGWGDAPEHEIPAGAEYRTANVNPTIRVLETGLVAFGTETAEVKDTEDSEWRELVTRFVVAAPVIVGGALWGAMTAARSGSEAFQPGAELRLKSFAGLMAQAIANTEAREELRASRARIVEAADEERRKLERNLHDGAQQRLVAVSISLRLAIAKLAVAPDDAHRLMMAAADELTHAIDELRELARGIHPAILTDRGLGPALEALAGRSPLRVDVDHDLELRLPPPVEAAAYYVVSESLTNIAKYAEATVVEVRVRRRNGVARVEVVDDGVGGADPTRGSGLRGLADRVEALDGRLGVESPPAAGTRVWAEIPLM